MDTLSKAGDAMLQAQDGNRQIAQALAAVVSRWFAPLKTWQQAMPTTLPPTERPRSPGIR